MYEEFYNLTGKPFQLSPDPSFFFGSRGHKRAMAYLEYGVEQAEGFIVITGEVGAGKTTLVRNLFEGLNRNEVIAAQLVSTQLEADDMLRAVCSAFGLEFRGNKAERLLALESFLLECQRKGKRCLLVVDEAQNLPPAAVEELRMLSNFQTSSGSLLQSFLVGQPEFRSTLQSPSMRQLRQRVIATYHLGPLDEEETRDYIKHRLQRVGWQNDPEFSNEAFEALHEYAGGVPRRINTVCDRLLLMAFLEELHFIDSDTVQEVINELDQDFGVRGDEDDTALQTTVNEGGQGSSGVMDDETASNIHARIEKLGARVSRLERYVVYTSKLSRQILTHVNKKKTD
ncbi:AAA family ATPase [Aquisalimonas sp. 2447]|uniref:XrtA/PEP-CTERM system-associated ATPase n=1 Tax=Aquisalimonas sp. 2447 TaxID=2740807 RepID=UPI00143269C3|nr:XrtA/PEP-CTERM system-associated ATPase [Aquisalimonas sp. 2447]QIT56539.1 AAA family ATPase [Aquisalimonas sp. 2447]